MNIKNFVLSYYSNAMEGFHIKKVTSTVEAQKPHTHEYFQIYYVIKGNITHYVGDEFLPLFRGDMVIIPPNKQHHIAPMDNESVFYSFSFMTNIFKEDDINDKIAVNFLNQLAVANYTEILPKITLPEGEILYMETVIDKIYKEFNDKNVGSEEIIYANAVIILTILARIYFETTKDVSLDVKNLNQYVLHCIRYIDDNFTEHLSLNEMAKRSAMSKSSFCNTFTKITGVSFKKYLNLKRIEHAVKLMKKGHQLTAIYSICGYDDYSTFVRNFKKIMGVSPSQYEK